MSITKYHCRGFNFTENISTIEKTVNETPGISIKEIDKNYLILEYARGRNKGEMCRCLNSIINEIEKERRRHV